MSKQNEGLKELTELLVASPPVGRRHPEMPYRMSLAFSTLEAWEAAVEQYGATVDQRAKSANDDPDGAKHWIADRRFGGDGEYFAGALLTLSHIGGGPGA